MVWRAETLFPRWFGGAYLELAIDRDRIAVDDFGVKPLGNGKRESRLSATSRAGKDDQQRIGISGRASRCSGHSGQG